MQEKKKTESKLATRAMYEAPQVVCFRYEAEGGILSASSDPVNANTSFGLNGQETETDGGFWNNQ